MGIVRRILNAQQNNILFTILNVSSNITLTSRVVKITIFCYGSSFCRMKAYYYIIVPKKLTLHFLSMQYDLEYYPNKKTTDDDIFFSCLWNVKRFRVLHLFMSYKLHDIFRRQIVDVVYSV